MKVAARDLLFSLPFVLVSLANLVYGVAFNLFLHLPGFLKLDLGADEAEIGLIFSLTALVAIAMRPWIGSSMDRRGRRPVILLGMLLNLVATGLYLAIDSVGLALYLVRFLHGVSEAMLFTALFTYASDCVPEALLTQGLAIFGVSGMLPIGIAGALGDWILAWGDFRALFLVSLGLGGVAFLAALPLREVAGPRPTAEEARGGFREALSGSSLLPIWWITATFCLALAAVFTFTKTYLLEIGVGSMTGFFGAYTWTAILLRVVAGWLPDRVGPKRVLVPALGTLAAGFVVLAGAGSGLAVMGAGILCGIGHGYAFPILFGMTVRRAPTAIRGSAMAVYTGLFDLGTLLGGPLFGLLIESYGYGVMYASAAGWVVAGTALFTIWDRGRR